MSAALQTAAEDTRLMQASEWVLRLQGAEPDEQTTAQWLEWCRADAENFAAFERMRGLWRKFDDPRLSGSLHFPSPSGRGARGEGFHHPQYSAVRLALAASVLIAIGVAVWFSIEKSGSGAYSRALSTAVGSLSRQTLPDGSTVELGPRSTLRVQLTHDRRSVFIDDGEAFFKVAKDPSRPFIVQAGDLEVVAVGTAFNVRKAEDRVVVTVSEGIVRVAPNDAVATTKPAGALAGRRNPPADKFARERVTRSPILRASIL